MEYVYRANDEYITTDNSNEADDNSVEPINLANSDSSETSLKMNNVNKVFNFYKTIYKHENINIIRFF